MRITVIGRPGRVVDRGAAVIVGLRSERVPPNPATDYAVVIGRRQWARVAETLRTHEDDRLIAEGHPTLDPRFLGITVLATKVTTTRLEQAQRQGQAAQEPAQRGPG